MSYIPYQKRIDQMLTDTFDAAGSSELPIAPITISGATTANPVVVTSATHSLAVGDWIYVTGATGTTEINGLRQVNTVPLVTTFTLKDEQGDVIGSAGTFGGTVTFTRAFGIQVPITDTAEQYHLIRMNGVAGDASAPVVDGMLGVARLTNGIYVKVYDYSADTHYTLTPKPVQGWRDWGLATGGSDAPLSDITNNKLEAGFRWTFTRNAENTGNRTDVVLDAGDILYLYSVDDLSGLTAFRVAVQGHLR